MCDICGVFRKRKGGVMENYICINGKKTKLTEEQMKALGIELPKAPEGVFARVEYGQRYYFAAVDGTASPCCETHSHGDDMYFEAANYCTDRALMEQRAMYEVLTRLLWRFSEMNGGRGVFGIAGKGNGNFCPMIENYRYLEPTFKTVDIANRAIAEIIKPFMKAHPDFVW